MDGNRLDSWTAVFSESSPTVIDKLRKLIDFGDALGFFEFACQQWDLREKGVLGTWDFLMESQIILRAVGHPALLTLKEAVKLTKLALQDDVLFDTKLLRRLLALRLWPEEVPSDEVLRTLGVLEALDVPHRHSMVLLKFSKFPDLHVQSKAAKILGRSLESVDLLDELFKNRDGRVRANLLEGLGRRDHIAPYLPLIERATRDQNTRVSSIALAIRARLGHGGSDALVRMRSNSKMQEIRRSAEFARHIAAGGLSGRDVDGVEIAAESETALLPEVNTLGVVDSEPAVNASVQEVHSEA